MRTGGVEPPQHEAAGLQPVELAVAQRPRGGVAERIRTDTARLTTSGASRYTTATMNEAGTTGLEPATSRLTSECSPQLSYAPRGSAGGIRTHDLELMRLARTAAPLPRKSGRLESNQRFPDPKSGGMTRFPTARKYPPRTRTRSFRVEGPASSPFDGALGSGGRARTCASRLTVARLTDSTTPERGGRRGSRTPKASRPARFRDEVPRQWQSFRKWPRQASNLHRLG
jgi:hypothetical protein